MRKSVGEILREDKAEKHDESQNRISLEILKLLPATIGFSELQLKVLNDDQLMLFDFWAKSHFHNAQLEIADNQHRPLLDLELVLKMCPLFALVFKNCMNSENFPYSFVFFMTYQ